MANNQPKKDSPKKQKKKKTKKPLISVGVHVADVDSSSSPRQVAGQYAYQDGVKDEEPLKSRNLNLTNEYNVANVATPAELVAGTSTTDEKGVAVYFVPPAKNGLGVFVGTRKAETTFHNDSDQMIHVTGSWCKNWSDEVDVVDTVEPFSLEIQPMSSKTTSCKKEWNWPLMTDIGTGVPNAYLMMRYYVHSSDAWSEKYKATLLENEGAPKITEKMKEATCLRRVTDIDYITTGGLVDDELATNLMAVGSFADFGDVNTINGTRPYPPLPWTSPEFKGRSGKDTKTITHFGVTPSVTQDRAAPKFLDVTVDLSGTGKMGIGTYPVDYYDDLYGWGSMTTLVCPSRENVSEDQAPDPWLNTYTTPDCSDDSNMEWELPVLSSMTLDENGNDSAFVGGRFKYFEQGSAYVLWDYIRQRPLLTGWGYNGYEGDYLYCGPKVFTGQKTVLRGVTASGFMREGKQVPKIPKINFVAVFSVVCSIIEVLYIASQAIAAHFERDAALQRLVKDSAYLIREEAKQLAAKEGLAAFLAMQDREHGSDKPRPRPRRDSSTPLDRRVVNRESHHRSRTAIDR